MAIKAKSNFKNIIYIGNNTVIAIVWIKNFLYSYIFFLRI